MRRRRTRLGIASSSRRRRIVAQQSVASRTSVGKSRDVFQRLAESIEWRMGSRDGVVRPGATRCDRGRENNRETESRESENEVVNSSTWIRQCGGVERGRLLLLFKTFNRRIFLFFFIQRVDELSQLNDELRFQLTKKNDVDDILKMVEVKESLIRSLSEKLEQCLASLDEEREERMKMDMMFNRMKNTMMTTIQELELQLGQQKQHESVEIEIQTDINGVELEEFKEEIESYGMDERKEEGTSPAFSEKGEENFDDDELFQLRGQLSEEKVERETCEIQVVQVRFFDDDVEEDKSLSFLFSYLKSMTL